MNRKIVVFDFDGTIADTGRGILNCARHALSSMNQLDPGEAILKKFIGPPLFTSFRDFCHLSDEDAERAVALFRERYNETGLFESDIYPGITPILAGLRAQGSFVAVASGKPEIFLRRIIAHFGLTDCFDAIAGTTPENHSSDKRGLILSVLPEGCDPADVWMVGDRCFDIDAGRALGLHTAAVEFGYGSREEFERSGAEIILPTTADLKKLLLGENLPRGKFITFEGSDGCGKSTQIEKLSKYLTSHGFEVVSTREPGGCPLSERIREIILSLNSEGMSPACEALLYAASRVEHTDKVILPALKEGKIVLCDRFLDSSIAYQAFGRELGEDFIRQINRAASDRVRPDRTLLFELDRTNAKARMAQGAPLDRLEREREDFFQRVAQGYDALACAEPDRVRRIDSSQDIETVFREVLDALREDLPIRG